MYSGKELWKGIIPFQLEEVRVSDHRVIETYPDLPVNLYASLVQTADRLPDKLHHGLIMLLHVAGHMVNDGGVGLRHLCDWAVYVHRVDLEKYKEELERIGLWIFACQLTAVSSAYLGLPKKHWAGEWPKQFLECLIDDFLTAGNFGRKHGGRSGTQLIGSTSFIEFIKKRVPIVRKYPILLPFGTIYYSFHYAICVMLGKRKIVEISTIEGAKERQRLYDQFQLFNTGQRIN